MTKHCHEPLVAVKNEVMRTRQKIAEVQEEMTSVKGKLVHQVNQHSFARIVAG